MGQTKNFNLQCEGLAWFVSFFNFGNSIVSENAAGTWVNHSVVDCHYY